MDQTVDSEALMKSSLGSLAEAALRAAGESFRRYFEESPLAMILVEPDGMRVAGANRQALAVFGYAAGELLGKSIEALTYPGDVIVSPEMYARVQRAGAGELALEKRYLRRDGSWFWAALAVTALRAPDGALTLLTGTLIDITHFKQAQDENRASVAFYRMAGRTARVGPWAVELPARTMIWSDEIRAALGVPPGARPSLPEAMGFLAPAARARAAETLENCIQAGVPFDEEWPVVTASGQGITCRFVGEALRDAAGNIYRVQGSFQDISHLKQFDAALHESNERLNLFVEYAPAALAMFDREMHYLAVSRRWVRDYGLEGREILGISHYEIFPEIGDAWKQAHRRGLAGEVVRREEDLFVRADGARQWVRWEIRPWRKAAGEVGGIVIFSEDITEVVRAREAIATHASELEEAMHGTLLAVSNMVEQRDPYTAGHERRVGIIAGDIAREMGWPEQQCKDLELIGLVHDIGKIAVPVEILTKPSRLSPMEYELVKQHVTRSYEILKDVKFRIPVAEIIYQHHERMDGSGYPRGLRGREILPAARILAVADVAESMAAHRPYRPALGLEAALGELTARSGQLYDAEVVATLERMVRYRGYTLPE